MTTAVVKDYYQDQDVARAYDRERFHGWAGRTFDALEKRAVRRGIRAVRPALSDVKVLDIPCGTGRITEVLLDEGLCVTGADISEQMMEVAQLKCRGFGDRVEFRRLDLDALELPDESFDLVTCIRLFHHLESPARQKVLKEIARISRQFVLANVSLSTTYYRLRRRAKHLLGQGVSRTSSTWREIRREVAAAGLRIHARYYVARGLSEDLVLLLTKR